MVEKYSDVSDYQKISEIKIKEGISAAKVGEKVGAVRIVDQENPGMTKIIKPTDVKEEILGLAESGESISHFKKETLVKQFDIQGSAVKAKKRERIIEVIKSLFSKKPTPFEEKENMIRQHAAEQVATEEKQERDNGISY